MNYIELANVLYPGVKYPGKFWENKYPRRNLPKNAEITRFAPSPTGFMHIGNFFSSLIDYKIAKTTGGVFFFRLEDTDKKREIVGADKVALTNMKNFGIVPDEGLTLSGEYGNYGPYRQSERLEIYQSYAKQLVSEGKAFPCFCEKPEGKDEILANREESLSSSSTIEDKDVCRDLTLEEIKQNIADGKKFALRLRSYGVDGERVKLTDEVRGEREFQANCKDVVLMKSNGIPPYAFAHAIDDHFMRTTTVVRGEEWLSTWPQHKEIYNALGFEMPKYVHIPLISKIGDNGNKRKISKSKDPEADMRFYSQAGIPKEAVLEYLLNLINSDFEIWRANNELANIDEFPFSISKMGSSSPMFDMVKLCDVSKTLISKMTSDEVFDKALEWARENDVDFAVELENNKEYAVSVFSIDRGGIKPRKDLAKWSDIKEQLGYMFDSYSSFTSLNDYELGDDPNKSAMKNVLLTYVSIVDTQDDKQTWFDRVKNMAGYLGFATDNKDYKQNPDKYLGNVATVCEYIRIALTGKKNSPDLYSIINVLKERKVKERLEKLANML